MTATTTTTRVSSLIKPNTSPKAVHFIIVCYMHSTKVKLILFQQWYSMHHIHFNILPYINLMYVINSLYLRWNFPERVRENRMFVTGCPCYKLSGLQVSGLYVMPGMPQRNFQSFLFTKYIVITKDVDLL